MKKLTVCIIAFALAACSDEAVDLVAGPDTGGGKSDEFDDAGNSSRAAHPMSADVVATLDGDADRDLCAEDGRYDDTVCDRSCDAQDTACPPREWLRDTLTVDLRADVQTGASTATITFAPEEFQGVSLRVNELDISSVTDASGDPLEYSIEPWGISAQFDQDDLGDVMFVPDALDEIVVEYIARTEPYADWDFGKTTLAWPTNCARIFPCNPRPDDGVSFSLDLENIPSGQVAIYPELVAADGPSYMLAWAVGAYEHELIGSTDAGTNVNVWWLAGSEDAARQGTTDLHLAFDWLEKTLGPYTFGTEVGSVEAQWGPGGLGGMEHHPMWHVASGSMYDRTTHVHEAVHGWFGDGIRIQCWEDFVLSEGVTTYLTARAIEEVWGAAAGEAVWEDYAWNMASWSSKEAWRPEACELETVNRTEIWSLAPYRRGAFFLRAVADEVGAETLDAALSSFYRVNVGEARRFVDLLDHIESETGFASHDLALDYLTGTMPSL